MDESLAARIARARAVSQSAEAMAKQRNDQETERVRQLEEKTRAQGLEIVGLFRERNIPAIPVCLPRPGSSGRTLDQVGEGWIIHEYADRDPEGGRITHYGLTTEAQVFGVYESYGIDDRLVIDNLVNPRQTYLDAERASNILNHPSTLNYLGAQLDM